MVHNGGMNSEWQQLDPALELVWLSTGNSSYAVTLDNDAGGRDTVVSFIDSDDGSSESGTNSMVDGRSSVLENMTASFHATPSRKPLAPLLLPRLFLANAPTPLELKTNETTTALTFVEQEEEPENSIGLFSCGGFGSGCRPLASANVVSDDDDDDDDSVETIVVGGMNSVLDKTTEISDSFSCTSLYQEDRRESLLDSARAHHRRLFAAKVSDRVVPTRKLSERKLPEEHGPIRKDFFMEQELDGSCSKSEATTDNVSNISFAQLASTILTSQAAKKAVEPLDRTAALLESKGVGRGTKIIREIRESTKLRVRLDDYSDANYWPLLDSLYFNKCLSKLVLFRRRESDNTRVRTQQELSCLFRVLNKRLSSTLKELHLWNFGPDDQATLARGLAYNSSLEYIQLHLETGTVGPSLAHALTTLPNLISLEVEVSSSFSVSTLLDSQSLGVLTVLCPTDDHGNDTTFDFDDDEIIALAEKLRVNSTLGVLHLEPRISCDIALPSILESLRSSNRTLETFQFSSTTSTFEQGDKALQCVLDVLRNNLNLRVLWNDCYESWIVSAKMRQMVFEVLKGNKSIQQFHIFPEAADFWYKKNNVLEQNMTCY